MTRIGMLRATLFAMMLVAPVAGAQTQEQEPEYAPPHMPYATYQYYEQHPEEWKKLLQSQPRVSHEITPGNKLAPGAVPGPGGWTAMAHPALDSNNQPVNLSNPVLLTDGTVIAHVSCTGLWYKLTPDNTVSDSVSYINGTWKPIASLPAGYAPRFFGSGVLPDGRVIVEGGEYNGSGNTCPRADTTQGAIYDPVADKWSIVNPPSGWAKIGDGGGIVLPNGTYMQTACCDVTRAPRCSIRPA